MFKSKEPLSEIAVKIAQRLEVSAEIHPLDMIYLFLVNNPSFSSKEEAVKYYFEDGLRSATKLLNLLKDVCGFDGSRKVQLFEFASGYGCVTRHFGKVIPFAEITSCDIHPEAVQFIKRIGYEAVLSVVNPDDFKVGQQYDVVFALSFFSHMPKRTFPRWIKALASVVKPEGYLIFTTHGLKSVKYFPSCQFDEDGFWFMRESEQKDLDVNEYGFTVTKPQYVFTQIFSYSDLAPVYFREGDWWGHQDTFVVKKTEPMLATKGG